MYGFFDANAAADFRWYHYAQAGSMVASGVCVVIGFWYWYVHSARARGYRWYIRATLVSIFITQVAIFLNSQLAALSGLSVNVLAYAHAGHPVQPGGRVAPPGRGGGVRPFRSSCDQLRTNGMEPPRRIRGIPAGFVKAPGGYRMGR